MPEPNEQTVKESKPFEPLFWISSVLFGTTATIYSWIGSVKINLFKTSTELTAKLMAENKTELALLIGSFLNTVEKELLPSFTMLKFVLVLSASLMASSSYFWMNQSKYNEEQIARRQRFILSLTAMDILAFIVAIFNVVPL